MLKSKILSLFSVTFIVLIVIFAILVGLFFPRIPTDETAPRVEILNPISTTYSTSQVDINVSVSDDSSVDTVLAEIDGSVNVTLAFYSGTLYYYDIWTFSEGEHEIRIFANDSEGNMNSSETVIFTVDIPDITAPSVLIQNPISTTYSISQVDINVSVSDDSSVDTVLAEIDGSVNVTLAFYSVTLYYYDIWTFSEGEHEIRIFANDSEGNMNSSETVIFTVDIPDITAPSVLIQNPISTTYSISQVDINVSVSDDSSVDTVLAEIDGSVNVTLAFYSDTLYFNNTCIFSDGPHSIRIFANDTNGNINSSETVVFTVDTPDNKAPSVEIVNPTSTTYSTSQVDINVSVSDDSSVDTVLAEIDNSVNVTLVFNSGTLYYNDTYSFSDGEHDIRIFANDSLGNMNFSETMTFTVDTTDSTPPSVLILNPTAITINEAPQVDINVSVSDSSSIDTVIAEIDNSVNVTLVFYSGTLYYNDTYSFSDGEHDIRIFANDSLGNMNSSETSTFTVGPSFNSRWVTHYYMGISNYRQIQLPLVEGGTYDFLVHWGDGTQDTITSWNQAEVKHTYPTYGEYEVNITGVIDGWSFNHNGDQRKLLEIEQWGPLRLGNSGSYFYGCDHLEITAEDELNVTGITNYANFFRFCDEHIYIKGLSDWDTVGVTNMSGMFGGLEYFNQNITKWDVSSVIDMNRMFRGNRHFNQNITGWDVSKVTDMSSMFSGANIFNQDISNWIVSRVTDMSYMFASSDFNQDINEWDVSSVTDMSSMFSYASDFNQDINSWDVSNVEDMSDMFSGAYDFNQNITEWDVSSVIDMSRMFYSADNFNQNISKWNILNVIDMSGMFQWADQFNQDISSWDVSNVEDMSDMFNNAGDFNQDLNNWDVSSVIDMSNMFYYATSFNQNIGNWDTSNVTDMAWMFREAWNFNQNIGNWKVSSVINMVSMFESCSSFDQDLNNWNTSSVINMAWMFSRSIFNQNISNWDVSSVTDMSSMFSYASDFNQNIGNWDVSSVTDMSNMFYYATSFNQNIGSWDVSNVERMDYMFTISTFNQDIGSWDVSNVERMDYMFMASTFNQDIGSWDVSSVTDMSDMFSGASSFNQDIGSWDVSNVDDMDSMLSGATSFNQNISSWDVSDVDDMSSMFSGATSFNQNISSWDVSEVDDIGYMFSGAISFNQDIGSWDVSDVSQMSGMFSGASSFDQNIGSWDVSNVYYMDNMFSGVTLSTANYDSLLIGWSALSLKNGVSFHAGNSQYSAGPSAAATARAYIISTYGWGITDGGSI